jgi:hypothetical protein
MNDFCNALYSIKLGNQTTFLNTYYTYPRIYFRSLLTLLSHHGCGGSTAEMCVRLGRHEFGGGAFSFWLESPRHSSSG